MTGPVQHIAETLYLLVEIQRVYSSLRLHVYFFKGSNSKKPHTRFSWLILNYKAMIHTIRKTRYKYKRLASMENFELEAAGVL